MCQGPLLLIEAIWCRRWNSAAGLPGFTGPLFWDPWGLSISTCDTGTSWNLSLRDLQRLYWVQLIQQPPHFLDGGKNSRIISVHTQHSENTSVQTLTCSHTHLCAHTHEHAHSLPRTHTQPVRVNGNTRLKVIFNLNTCNTF